jgi:hypothetical protein
MAARRAAGRDALPIIMLPIISEPERCPGLTSGNLRPWPGTQLRARPGPSSTRSIAKDQSRDSQAFYFTILSFYSLRIQVRLLAVLTASGSLVISAQRTVNIAVNSLSSVARLGS